ncbi:MAG: tyrosine-type recombinase/integrase [Dehalobacterium sp.]
MSPTTIKHLSGVLHKGFNDAIKWRMLNLNPCDAVTSPKRSKHEIRVASQEELERIIEGVTGHYLEIPVFLGITTGARLGEILGLSWDSIDLDKGIIRITQALKLSNNGGLILSDPKTARGKRSIEIGPQVVKRLTEYKAEQAAWKLQSGENWRNEHNLVCTLNDGNWIRPNTASSTFGDIARRLGINISFHALRHGHATELLKAGVNPKIVCERLGHSTVSMTLDVYSHVVPGMQKEAARVIDTLLNKEDEKIALKKQ